MSSHEDKINSVQKDGLSQGFFGYDYRELQIDPDWKPDESVAFPLVMRKGQAVIFWSTLMHASLPNTSTGKNYRMGFAARYVPTSVRVYPDTTVVQEYGAASRWTTGARPWSAARTSTGTIRWPPGRCVADC